MKAKRTDSNQKEIVQKLRDAGKDRPDLLVCLREWVLVEIKTPDGEFSRGQLRFLADAKGYVGVASNFEACYALATAPKEFALTQWQKDRLSEFLGRWSGESISFRKLAKELAN